MVVVKNDISIRKLKRRSRFSGFSRPRSSKTTAVHSSPLKVVPPQRVPGSNAFHKDMKGG